jgi:asparagine synthase (glutamine-hydrolysing)
MLGAVPLSRAYRATLSDTSVQRLARLLAANDEHDLYERLITSDGISVMSEQPPAPAAAPVPPLRDIIARIIYRDMTEYLPGDVLVKLDRASMAASLEARCPFLDHRMIEFAWRVPTALKVRGGQGKWLLRRVLHRYLPRKLFERPKQGFNVPIGAWLRGPLHNWARDLLDAPRIRRDGFLDPDKVETCWREHLSGQVDRARELWAILMVQAWLEAMRRPPSVIPVAPMGEPAIAPAVAMTRGRRRHHAIQRRVGSFS